MGLHFGFPGLEARERNAGNLVMAAGGTKSLERSKYMNVPAGRQARHPLIHGFEHVPRLFVRWGWWGGMEAT